MKKLNIFQWKWEMLRIMSRPLCHVYVIQWSARSFESFFFFPQNSMNRFHGCAEECCVVPPWTKASEAKEGGIGIFGFWAKNFGFSVLLFFRIWFSVFVKYINNIFSGLSSIWAAIKRLHWPRTAAKRLVEKNSYCYLEEYVRSQMPLK